MDLPAFIQVFASDTFVFFILHVVLAVFVIYAVFRRRHESFSSFRQNSNNFVLAYSVIAASIVQAVQVAEVATGFKMIIAIADLGGAFYLCFYSGWFRTTIARVFDLRPAY